jgi:hypothetical protein
MGLPPGHLLQFRDGAARLALEEAEDQVGLGFGQLLFWRTFLLVVSIGI